MKIICIKDFKDPLFCNAFKMYFKELKIEVKDYESLFNEMNEEGNNLAYICANQDEILGFIQFQENQFENWFFKEKFGYIREFWVRQDVRNQGLGTKLLHECETYFKSQGIERILLTSDEAISFYEKKGYRLSRSCKAINQDQVLSKNI